MKQGIIIKVCRYTDRSSKQKGGFVKKYRVTAILAVVVMTMLTLSGCTTFDNFKKAFIETNDDISTTVQIGIYEPTSGADSKNAKAEIEGIELAHELYPNIGGKVVELVYGDNASDIYAAETAAKDLVSKKPAVILGSYGSVYSLVAGDIIYDAKIPAIAMTNTNPLVTKNNPYYFRVCYVDSNQGDILARYVLEDKKEKSAGVLAPEDDDAALAMTTAFTDRIKTQTGNEDAIVAYEQYKTGDEDFKDQLEEIQQSGAKSVLLPGEMADSARILEQADEMGLDVLFLGDSDWSTDEFRKMYSGSQTGNNMAFINFFTSDETTTRESETFLKAYHNKYGSDSEPDNNVALGFDAYVVAIKAIDKVDGDITGENVKQILSSGQYAFKGATGEIKFNNIGDPIKTAYISTWQNDKMETICTIEPTL